MGEIADSILGDICESDAGWFRSHKKKIRCNKCGSTKVYWVKLHSGKYCLFDKETNRGHICNPNDIPDKPDIKYVPTCYTCSHYFIQGRCTKHGISTGHSNSCKEHSDYDIPCCADCSCLYPHQPCEACSNRRRNNGL